MWSRIRSASGTTSWPTPSPGMTAMENSSIQERIMEVSTVVLVPYNIENAGDLLTPALAIYPDLVDHNIATTIRLLGGDANRWRPHVKTAKLGFIMRRLREHG